VSPEPNTFVSSWVSSAAGAAGLLRASKL
jgi:hypothetical protein